MGNTNFFQSLFLFLLGISLCKCSKTNYASKSEVFKSDNNQSKKEINQANLKTSGLKLIWADEFDIDGAPNTAKWGNDIGTGDWGWGNNELEYYTDRKENAVIANGVLKINAIKESYKGSIETSSCKTS